MHVHGRAHLEDALATPQVKRDLYRGKTNLYCVAKHLEDALGDAASIHDLKRPLPPPLPGVLAPPYMNGLGWAGRVRQPMRAAEVRRDEDTRQEEARV